MNSWMRSALGAALMALGLSAASITYDTSTVGTNGSGETVYRYVFHLTDVPLDLDQELSLRFAASEYQTLLNGQAPVGFDLLLFQPNVPGGADGVYSLVALISQPSMAGLFSVDFTLTGGGPPSGFTSFISDFDANGGILNTVAIANTVGNTVTLDLTETPEPSTLVLALSGVIFARLISAGSRLRR